jgi:predicted nucleic acid-binding protein
VSFYFLETTAFAKLFVQEPGTKELIQMLEAIEDNHKLIAASSPLELHAAIRRRERLGDLSAADAASALDSLRSESARAVQQPLNPAVLESARQLIDHANLRWPDALQLAAAMTARTMYQGMTIVFVSALENLRKAAKAEGFEVLDPARIPTVAAEVLPA